MLAQEAAKIIATEGVRDYKLSKLKAMERIGNSYHGSLPSNVEIEHAIFSYHNTFSINHQALLYELREVAYTVMQWLENFSPYLVGSVLEGTANTATPINIHIASDTLESVIEELQLRELRPSIGECGLKINGVVTYLPKLIFDYESYEIELIIFDLRQQHQKPKSKDQSIRRMSLKSLEGYIKHSNDKPDLTLLQHQLEL